jgi:hypothetical protein
MEFNERSELFRKGSENSDAMMFGRDLSLTTDLSIHMGQNYHLTKFECALSDR